MRGATALSAYLILLVAALAATAYVLETGSRIVLAEFFPSAVDRTATVDVVDLGLEPRTLVKCRRPVLCNPRRRYRTIATIRLYWRSATGPWGMR